MRQNSKQRMPFCMARITRLAYSTTLPLVLTVNAQLKRIDPSRLLLLLLHRQQRHGHHACSSEHSPLRAMAL